MACYASQWICLGISVTSFVMSFYAIFIFLQIYYILPGGCLIRLNFGSIY
ncbi:hypothetical protein PHAVU_001G222400 [Phaseolus vulgaris]|uniref:Uncharacterized protein n=1 Tax=Phaseolus vulgaris TaxID=3885 RepID=V7D258_PHAVU|nr:hypothetical protein PHAVU_001G222400g [Phaseolus vulgaris]ESW35286.1 hypothetical protein PHAVU_001G222400g [Phaseolus vulgaris]